MGTTTYHDRERVSNTPPTTTADVVRELRALRAEMRAAREENATLRRLFDAFAGTFLNAKFPYGRATDRWARQ